MNAWMQYLTLADEVTDTIEDRPDAADVLAAQAENCLKQAHEARERLLEEQNPSYVAQEYRTIEQEEMDEYTDNARDRIAP